MAASSIQLSQETRERLRAYKIEGMTYEQVVRMILDLIDPDEFHQLYRDWQRKTMERIRASKNWETWDLDRAP